MVRRREEIRIAVLEEKAYVKRTGESGEEVRRKLQTLQSSSENRRKSGGKPEADGLAERRAPVLTWRNGTESDSRPHLLPQTEQ